MDFDLFGVWFHFKERGFGWLPSSSFLYFYFFVFLEFLSEVFVQIWSCIVSITLGIFLVSLVFGYILWVWCWTLIFEIWILICSESGFILKFILTWISGQINFEFLFKGVLVGCLLLLSSIFIFVFLEFLSEVFVQIWSCIVSITLGIFLVSLVFGYILLNY